MITAVIPVLEDARVRLSGLSSGVGSLAAITPTLGAFSQAPSLKVLGNDHSLAIVGDPGNSISLYRQMHRQMMWAARNLSELASALQNHESEVASVLRKFNPIHGDGTPVFSLESTKNLFQRRPEFNAGALSFAPVSTVAEAAMDADALLNLFTSTNNGAVADAIAYWSDYAVEMERLSGEVAGIGSQLASTNQGLVFTAAQNTLQGLAARATNLAASATVMSGHLQALLPVRDMGIAALSAIQAESKAIPHPIAQEAFERAEVAAFITGPYRAALQAAVPAIPNLVSGDFGAGVTSVASTGVSVAGLGGTTQAGLSPRGMAAGATTPQFAAPVTASHVESIPGSGAMTTPAAAQLAPTPMTQSSLTSPVAPQSALANNLTSMPAAPATTSASAPVLNPGAASAAVSPRGTAGLVPATTSASQRISGPNSAARAATLSGGATISSSGRGHTGFANGGRGSSHIPVPGSRSGDIWRGGNAAGLRGGVSSGSFGAPVGAHQSATRVGFLPPANGQGIGALRAPTSSGASVSVVPAGSSNPTTGSGNRSAAHMFHAVGQQAGAAGSARPGGRRQVNVSAIRATDAGAFEQNEYQRELFGDPPATVPSVIGRNVRR